MLDLLIPQSEPILISSWLNWRSTWNVINLLLLDVSFLTQMSFVVYSKLKTNILKLSQHCFYAHNSDNYRLAMTEVKMLV